MQELEKMKIERLELQEKYLNEVQNIWSSDIELVKKDSKARKLYKEYKHKDLYLEKVCAVIESVLEDIEHYNNKMK